MIVNLGGQENQKISFVVVVVVVDVVEIIKHEVCKIKFSRGNPIKFFLTWNKLSQQE